MADFTKKRSPGGKLDLPGTKIKMKTGLCIILFAVIWIITITSQAEAYLLCDQNGPVSDKCRKVHEIPRTPIFYRVCGDNLISAYKQVCFYNVRVKRKASDILLGQYKAKQFLSSHHRTKRSFNAVEECCSEGCMPEELYEYCKP